MHHELRQSLDLDWYRRRARNLVRAYSRNDLNARKRVGKRDRFQLADAQHVIALEHGYRNWTDFKLWVESRGPEPSVGRIGRAPLSTYHASAQQLVDAAARGDDDALRRVRAHVPRLSNFASRALALREARLVDAEEYRFFSWSDLLRYAQRLSTCTNLDRQAASPRPSS